MDDMRHLRQVLRHRIIALKDAGTHDDLPGICERLGLPPPDGGPSKRERMIASFEAIADGDLPSLAEKYLLQYPQQPNVRNEIQEAFWTGLPPSVSVRTRREIARGLQDLDLYLDRRRFDELVERFWDLNRGGDVFAFFQGLPANDLRDQIARHVHRNPGDWSVEYLFDALGAFECSDRRFVLFLEGLASCQVRPDEGALRAFAEQVNAIARRDGIELREMGSKDGYPVFSVVSTRLSKRGSAKNLIFASAVKPDLRFRDAIDNDIEIVTNTDKVLVFDRHIPAEGLLWHQLQSWWADLRGISDAEIAKRTLYHRLRDSLPAESPPQHLFFDAFHRGFGCAIPELPALLPEVWLHWDPKTAAERGRDALLRFRMDFLMLLPGGARVVFEIDGRHHYATQAGHADAARYAAMMAGDRDLKLADYEVFRFGAAELNGEGGERLVSKFFRKLFERYRVQWTGAGIGE